MLRTRARKSAPIRAIPYFFMKWSEHRNAIGGQSVLGRNLLYKRDIRLWRKWLALIRKREPCARRILIGCGDLIGRQQRICRAHGPRRLLLRPVFRSCQDTAPTINRRRHVVSLDADDNRICGNNACDGDRCGCKIVKRTCIRRDLDPQERAVSGPPVRSFRDLEIENVARERRIEMVENGVASQRAGRSEQRYPLYSSAQDSVSTRHYWRGGRVSCVLLGGAGERSRLDFAAHIISVLISSFAPPSMYF